MPPLRVEGSNVKEHGSQVNEHVARFDRNTGSEGGSPLDGLIGVLYDYNN